MHIEDAVPLNAPGFGNFSMTPDGYVWDSRDNNVRKIDPETGKVVQRYPLQVSFSYDNLISADGKYYGGGGLPAWGNTIERMDLSTGEWIKQNTGEHMVTAKRGGFDPYDNPWFGGGDGALIELNAKTGLIEEHVPPIAPSPYTDFYEASRTRTAKSGPACCTAGRWCATTRRPSAWTCTRCPSRSPTTAEPTSTPPRIR